MKILSLFAVVPNLYVLLSPVEQIYKIFWRKRKLIVFLSIQVEVNRNWNYLEYSFFFLNLNFLNFQCTEYSASVSTDLGTETVWLTTFFKMSFIFCNIKKVCDDMTFNFWVNYPFNIFSYFDLRMFRYFIILAYSTTNSSSFWCSASRPLMWFVSAFFHSLCFRSLCLFCLSSRGVWLAGMRAKANASKLRQVTAVQTQRREVPY